MSRYFIFILALISGVLSWIPVCFIFMLLGAFTIAPPMVVICISYIIAVITTFFGVDFEENRES